MMPKTKPVEVRRLVPSDLPAVAKLAGVLVRLHTKTDRGRFLRIPNVEAGYSWYFGTQLRNKRAVILVAERNGRIEGYSYGSLESRNWNLLLDKHGAIHDVCVARSRRRGGIGRALMTAMIDALIAKGAQRIVLSTMVQNEAAQRLFSSLGFRPTMIEMTFNPPR